MSVDYFVPYIVEKRGEKEVVVPLAITPNFRDVEEIYSQFRGQGEEGPNFGLVHGENIYPFDPKKQKLYMGITELHWPKHWGTRAGLALTRNGYHTVADVMRLFRNRGNKEVSDIVNNYGTKSAEMTRRVFEEIGIEL